MICQRLTRLLVDISPEEFIKQMGCPKYSLIDECVFKNCPNHKCVFNVLALCVDNLFVCYSEMVVDCSKFRIDIFLEIRWVCAISKNNCYSAAAVLVFDTEAYESKK